MATRICVKNLPKHLTDEQLAQHFSKTGTVTDARIMHTPDGKTRQFGFVGYKTEAEAAAALKHFNKTYIHTSKIDVSVARDVGDESIPRAWSRYTKEKQAAARGGAPSLGGQPQSRTKVKYKHKNLQKKLGSLPLTTLDPSVEPELAEFLAVMQRRGVAKTWANDDVLQRGLNAVAPEARLEEAARSSKRKRKSEQDSDDSSESDKDGEEGRESEGRVRPSEERAAKRAKREAAEGSGHPHDDNDDDDNDDDDDQGNSEKEKEGGSHGGDGPGQGDDYGDAGETGRLFVGNIPYTTTEDELSDYFKVFGEVTEVHIPMDETTHRNRGYGFVSFMFPDHAAKALAKANSSIFAGRLLHLLPSTTVERKTRSHGAGAGGENGEGSSSFKKGKLEKNKELAGSKHNWNSLFMRADTVADAAASLHNVSKSQLLDPTSSNMGVVLALSEVQVVSETKAWLESEGVVLKKLEGYRDKGQSRSRTVVLIKNLPYDTGLDDLKALFERFGPLGRFLLPPTKTMALAEFLHPNHAKKAFRALAYTAYLGVPLMLEMAPEGVLRGSAPASVQKEEGGEEAGDNAEKSERGGEGDSGTGKKPKVKGKKDNEEEEKQGGGGGGGGGGKTKAGGLAAVNLTSASGTTTTTSSSSSNPATASTTTTTSTATTTTSTTKASSKASSSAVAEDEDGAGLPRTTLYIKNIGFDTSEDELRKVFEAIGPVRSVTHARRRDAKRNNELLSLGYGFVEFEKPKHALKALIKLQNVDVNGHALILKFSEKNQAATNVVSASKDSSNPAVNDDADGDSTQTKIIVRNLPFEVTKKDIRELFGTVATLKSVRLPKKFDNSPRGFAFVEFLTHNEAAAAMAALSSAHLLGRHMVMEWAAKDEGIEALMAKTARHYERSKMEQARPNTTHFTFDD